jgi:hypothetical protein
MIEWRDPEAMWAWHEVVGDVEILDSLNNDADALVMARGGHKYVFGFNELHNITSSREHE